MKEHVYRADGVTGRKSRWGHSFIRFKNKLKLSYLLNSQKETKSFSLEKILTVTASEYCASVGKELGEYELRGIYYHSYFNLEKKMDNPSSVRDSDLAFFLNSRVLRPFAVLVPTNAEAVVNYSFKLIQIGEILLKYALGTALIPKRQKK